MAELPPEAALDRAPTPVAVAGLRLVSMRRGDETRERASRAARRLLQLVAEWGPDVALEITYGSTGRSGNAASFTLVGAQPPSWRDDLRWALEDIGTLGADRRPSATPPRHVLELVAQRSTGPRAAAPSTSTDGDLVQAELMRQARLRAAEPWPLAMHADLASLLRLNVGDWRTGLVLRYRLAGTSRLERDMLREELDQTFDPSRLGLHDYLGRPVRLRAYLGAPRPVPARARALVAEWGSGLDLVEVPADMIESTWSGDPVSLAGHAVPHGTALAVVRVPVASQVPFPGMKSVAAPVTTRPLDPVPARPTRPVHLGVARTSAQRRVAVALGLDDLLQHCFVQGASGSGKSTLLATVAVGVLDAGGSVTVLDPEGSTVTSVLHQVRAEHAPHLRVVRHGTADLDVPLNLLAAGRADRERMVGMFAEMVQRAQDPQSEGIVGPRWKRWFTLLCLAAGEVLGPDASLVTVAAIATDMSRVRELAAAVRPTNPDLAHRLLAEYGRLEGKEATELISWAISKLNEVISSEEARWIFGAGPDGVDVAEVMSLGHSLLVDLGSHRLGEPTGRAIGATYLLKHWAALGSRRRGDSPHVVLVDEAHLFSYGALPKLLAEARKFGVGVVVATQHVGQLAGELADALESNTGSFLSLRAGIRSATRASVRLEGWPTGELVRLPDLTAAATLSRGGVATAPFTLELDHHTRVRRWTRDSLVGADVAAGVVAASTAAAARYRTLRPLGDDELTARINGAGPVATDAESELDAWIARQRVRPARP